MHTNTHTHSAQLIYRKSYGKIKKATLIFPYTRDDRCARREPRGGGRARAAEEARRACGESRPGAPLHNERVWKAAAAAGRVRRGIFRDRTGDLAI